MSGFLSFNPCGLVDSWTRGLADLRTRRLADLWTCGLLDSSKFPLSSQLTYPQSLPA